MRREKGETIGAGLLWYIFRQRRYKLLHQFLCKRKESIEGDIGGQQNVELLGALFQMANRIFL